jgi:hypothetical protein
LSQAVRFVTVFPTERDTHRSLQNCHTVRQEPTLRLSILALIGALNRVGNRCRQLRQTAAPEHGSGHDELPTENRWPHPQPAIRGAPWKSWPCLAIGGGRLIP